MIKKIENREKGLTEKFVENMKTVFARELKSAEKMFKDNTEVEEDDMGREIDIDYYRIQVCKTVWDAIWGAERKMEKHIEKYEDKLCS